MAEPAHLNPFVARRAFLRRLGGVLGVGWILRQPLLAPAWGDDGNTYVVKRGDTLSEIAEKHGIRLSQLRALNGLQTDHILPGQRLRVGSPTEFPLLASVRSAIAVPNLNRARWKHVILHHSATAGGNAAIFDRYHRQQRHMENGLAYHFIIGNGSDSGDGQIEVGSRWTRQLNGGHVRSFALNENSVGICLVGNFEQTRPTQKQIAAALELVTFVKTTLLHDKVDLLFHREIKGEHTLCPGRNFPAARFRKHRA